MSALLYECPTSESRSGRLPDPPSYYALASPQACGGMGGGGLEVGGGKREKQKVTRHPKRPVMQPLTY